MSSLGSCAHRLTSPMRARAYNANRASPAKMESTVGTSKPAAKVFSRILTMLVVKGTLCLTSARVRRSLHEIPWILELVLTSFALRPKMPSAKFRASRKDWALVAGARSLCIALK